jgi:hypothetical protein
VRYFVAVAEERHVTRAAARLHVSQPALSKPLRALERQVGAVLLRRLPHGVELTAAGEALLPDARALVERADLAARDVADAARVLVVGVSTGVGRRLLPAVRSRAAAREPGVDPRLRTVAWDDPTVVAARGSTGTARPRWSDPRPPTTLPGQRPGQAGREWSTVMAAPTCSGMVPAPTVSPLRARDAAERASTSCQADGASIRPAPRRRRHGCRAAPSPSSPDVLVR